jgi:hypothetical protein
MHRARTTHLAAPYMSLFPCMVAEKAWSLRNEVVRKLITNFRNPPGPPFDKGGLGGFQGKPSIPQYTFLVPVQPGLAL